MLPSQGSAQTCFSTHSPAWLGAAQCLPLPGFPAWLTAPGPQPLRLPWAQLLPPKPRGHSQLNESHWFTQVPPLWQVLLSHTFFLAGQPRVEEGGSGGGTVAGARGALKPHMRVSQSRDSPSVHGAPGLAPPQAPIPGMVPLLAMKSAMSTCRLSTCRFLMQPTKCRVRTGKLSGRSGTPPSSRGPVRSRDLRQRQGW